MEINLRDIEKAKERIKTLASHTPLYESQFLSKQCSCEVDLKLECYQPIRVFKIRGAANKMLSLAENHELRNVVAFSAGNHGLAVVYVAYKLGVQATIVVPNAAVQAKVNAMSEYPNSKIVRGGATVEELKAVAEKIAKDEGSVLVHPFADPYVICGQGTIGLEIVEDQPSVDTILVPIGGGGLISGISAAAKAKKKKDCKIVGICAEGAPAAYKSFKEDRIVSQAPKTIADGMGASTTDPLNLELMKKYVDDMVLVSDGEIKHAMKILIEDLHVLTEPAGAASVAALLSGRYKPSNKEEVVVPVLSGGNVNPSLIKEVLLQSS
jgi:threonine dehydratase